MKKSVLFRPWNLMNFRPPLNRHVPVAWLPKIDGFQWLRRPGFPGKTIDVIFSSQSPHMANFAYYFAHFGHFDAELLSFFQWWEGAVSCRIAAIAQIEQLESPCILVHLLVHFWAFAPTNYWNGNSIKLNKTISDFESIHCVDPVLRFRQLK